MKMKRKMSKAAKQKYMESMMKEHQKMKSSKKVMCKNCGMEMEIEVKMEDDDDYEEED